MDQTLCRILKRTKLDSSTGCLLWQGSKANGYGRIRTGSRQDGSRKLEIVTRVVFRLFNGVDLGSGFVLHKCDTPACVNPEHLYLGNHSQNMRDKVIRGRQTRSIGEANPRSKLCAQQVDEIRRAYKAGGWSCVRLAKQYGVGHTAIWRIVSGIGWCELPAAPEVEK